MTISDDENENEDESFIMISVFLIVLCLFLTTTVDLINVTVFINDLVILSEIIWEICLLVDFGLLPAYFRKPVSKPPTLHCATQLYTIFGKFVTVLFIQPKAV